VDRKLQDAQFALQTAERWEQNRAEVAVAFWSAEENRLSAEAAALLTGLSSDDARSAGRGAA